MTLTTWKLHFFNLTFSPFFPLRLKLTSSSTRLTCRLLPCRPLPAPLGPQNNEVPIVIK